MKFTILIIAIMILLFLVTLSEVLNKDYPKPPNNENYEPKDYFDNNFYD